MSGSTVGQATAVQNNNKTTTVTPYLPFSPSRTYPAVTEVPGQPSLNTMITSLVEHWWKRFVTDYNVDDVTNNLAHDPIADGTPRHINAGYSEGVDYGQEIGGLYTYNQERFDILLDGAMTYLFNKNGMGGFGWRAIWDPAAGLYNYCAYEYGADEGNWNTAADADFGIGSNLIDAWKLQQHGYFGPSPHGYNYYDIAQQQVENFKSLYFDPEGYIKIGAIVVLDTHGDPYPGDAGGSYYTNPSYFDPAMFKKFDEFEEIEGHELWQRAIDVGYELILSDRFVDGFVSDWSNWMADSTLYFGGVLQDTSFGKEACRLWFRITKDAIFYNEPRAFEFLRKVADHFRPQLPTTIPANTAEAVATGIVDNYDPFTGAALSGQPNPQIMGMMMCALMGADNPDITTLRQNCLNMIYYLYHDPTPDPYDAYAGDVGMGDLRIDEAYFQQSMFLKGLLMAAGLYWDIYNELGGGNGISENNGAGQPKVFDLGSYPNPTNGAVTIKYEMPAGAAVRVEIIDIGGRSRRIWDLGYQSAGPKEIKWDCRDNSGLNLPNGIYLCQITSDGKAETTKIQIVK